MRILMLKIRRSRDSLIFNLGIPILVRRHLYIEMAPWLLNFFFIFWFWSRQCLTYPDFLFCSYVCNAWYWICLLISKENQVLFIILGSLRIPVPVKISATGFIHLLFILNMSWSVFSTVKLSLWVKTESGHYHFWWSCFADLQWYGQ